MDYYLHIGARFIDPRFHGQKDDGAPEWPPSPVRLYQALLSATRTGINMKRWYSDGILETAYRWLERQPPPVILAPPATAQGGYRFFPPRNDADDLNITRQDMLVAKDVRPMVFDSPEDTTVHYLWRVPEEEYEEAKPHMQTMVHEAEYLTNLGWGIDMVTGIGDIILSEEAVNLPGERWMPFPYDAATNNRLRVPIEGTLRDLEDVYELRRQNSRKQAEFRKYRTVRYLKAQQTASRHFASFEFPEDNLPVRQEAIARVGMWTRSMVCRMPSRVDFHEQFGDPPEVFLGGHVLEDPKTQPRFSYLPLPSIGHPHADGMIRRVLIAEPYGFDGKRAEWAQTRFMHEELLDDFGGKRAEFHQPWRETSPRMIDRYTGADKEWTSVTPVILRAEANGKSVQQQVDSLMAATIRHAGIDPEAVESYSVRKAPFWNGAQIPMMYFLPKRLRSRLAWHVSIKFREPVAGPMSIGAGRFLGLGLMAHPLRGEVYGEYEEYE